MRQLAFRAAIPLLTVLVLPYQGQAQEPAFAPVLGIDLAAMRRVGALYWRDLTVGDGATARDGGVLTIHYTGWLADGTRFESSRDANDPVTFQMGKRQVIRGWEDGVRGMRVGGIRQLVIPPRLGYAGRGVPGKVPPNATLVFEVELLAIGR